MDAITAAEKVAAKAARELDDQLKKEVRLKTRLEELQGGDEKTGEAGLEAETARLSVSETNQALRSSVLNDPFRDQLTPLEPSTRSERRAYHRNERIKKAEQANLALAKSQEVSLEKVTEERAAAKLEIERLRESLRKAEAEAGTARASLRQIADSDFEAAGVEARMLRARRAVEEAKKVVERAKKIVYPLGGHLTTHGYSKVMPVARARVPVVKCISPDGASCDVVINNTLAVYNTRAPPPRPERPLKCPLLRPLL